MTHNAPGQAGFSLVSTLFVLIVLALLGGYMVKLSAVQHATNTMSVQSARGWFAALSGLDWVAYQLNQTADCLAGNGAQCCGDLTSNFDVDGFSLQISQCAFDNIQEGTDHYRLYRVGLTASRGAAGTADRVSRQLVATLAGP